MPARIQTHIHTYMCMQTKHFSIQQCEEGDEVPKFVFYCLTKQWLLRGEGEREYRQGQETGKQNPK